MAKIAAVIGVVIVHTDSAPNDALVALGNHTWLVTDVVEVLFRWCVPVFVMVSGMLLLQSRTAEAPPLSFYRRRAARVAIPLICWTVFYRFFAAWTGTHANFEENVQAVYGGVPYFHLYFLYVIAGLYLIAPYLARAIDDLSVRQLGSLAVGLSRSGFSGSGCPRGCRGPAATPSAFSLPSSVTSSPAAGWPACAWTGSLSWPASPSSRSLP